MTSEEKAHCEGLIGKATGSHFGGASRAFHAFFWTFPWNLRGPFRVMIQGKDGGDLGAEITRQQAPWKRPLRDHS